MNKAQFYEEIIERIKDKKLSKHELSMIKLELCNKYGLDRVPNDFEIMLHAKEEDLAGLRDIQTKPTRTISGVAVVAIMTKPIKCPHGKCSYCPGGVNSVFGDTPQSYTGKEPATMRGIRNKYDPYLQIFNRLEQYIILGHEIDKIEMIVMGGTFPSTPTEYKEDFIKYSYKAFNDFSELFFKDGKLEFMTFKEFFELPGEIGSTKRIKSIHNKLLELKGVCVLEEEQLKNLNVKVRCVALCIETRPDYCKQEHINEMLRFGTTRVELGVQSLNNDVLNKIERGHSVEESVKATKLMKDSLLKVGYHMMPGLPLTSREQDLEMIKQLFSDERFKPDALKIYPCMVMPGTELYKDYESGKFKPINTQEAAELIAEMKRDIPKYCRIMRVQRDIPTKVTSAGVDRTNLRQYVKKITEEKGIKCKCIRCREPKNVDIKLKDVKIMHMKYKSSDGIEFFISAEDVKQDVLLGFCRLRFVSEPFRKEFIENSAGIRELHVYGSAVAIGKQGKIQHRGLGKKLVAEAEMLAREHGKNKMLIISGMGVRGYYEKLGYKLEGAYMTKEL